MEVSKDTEQKISQLQMYEQSLQNLLMQKQNKYYHDYNVVVAAGPLITGIMGEKWNVLLGNIGVLVYAGIGFLCLLMGANFLDYSILSKILPATDRVMARSHGMLGVEIGVAIAVMAIVVSIYLNIVSQGKYDKGL